MRSAALAGTLTVGHELPVGARLLCRPGQEIEAGEPIAEIHAPGKTLAVALKHLEGIAVGDQVPAGTTIGGERGWRGRRKALEWDARIVALNPAAGYAFLCGPDERIVVRARISGLAGAFETGLPFEIRGSGLAFFSPLARGPDAFGRLALGGGIEDRSAANSDRLIAIATSVLGAEQLIAEGIENLTGLLVPGIAGRCFCNASDSPSVEVAPELASISVAVAEVVSATELSDPLRSILEPLSGNPASLAVHPVDGTGELIVSGSVDQALLDFELVRGFGSRGIVIGRPVKTAAPTEVRVAGGRMVAGIELATGDGSQLAAGINAERFVADSA